jgi:hypothetical protein
MRFRKLQIVWSVACGIACLLLIALWVRSHWCLQIFEQQTASKAAQISSVKGRIAVAILDPRTSTTRGRSYLSVAPGDAADWRKGGVSGFAYHADRSMTALVAPHWLPALLCSAIAVVPWISQSWRFSLRTLLVVTALVAAVFGLTAAVLR